MNPGLLPLLIVFAAALVVTVAVPGFWSSCGDLPYDEDDATRGDWKAIPSQGHPQDRDLR